MAEFLWEWTWIYCSWLECQEHLPSDCGAGHRPQALPKTLLGSRQWKWGRPRLQALSSASARISLWRRGWRRVLSREDGPGGKRSSWGGSIETASKTQKRSFKLDLEGVDGCGLLERSGKDILWKLSWQLPGLSFRIFTEVVCKRAFLIDGLGSWFPFKKQYKNLLKSNFC